MFLVGVGIFVVFVVELPVIASILIRMLTGIPVVIHGLGVYPFLRAESIYVFEDLGTYRENRPLAILEGVRITYDFRSQTGRYFPIAYIEKMRFDIESGVMAQSSQEPSPPYPSPRKSRFPIAFIPCEIQCPDSSFSIASSSGRVELEKLQVITKINSLSKFEFMIKSEEMKGSVASPRLSSPLFVEGGNVTLHFHKDEHGIEIPVGELNLQGLLVGSFTGKKSFAQDAMQLEWDIRNATIDGTLLMIVMGFFMPPPLGLKQVVMERCRGKIAVLSDELNFLGGDIHAELQEVNVGQVQNDIRLGNLTVEGNIAENSGKFFMTMSNQKLLQIVVNYPKEVRFETDKWSTKEIIDFLPSSWRGTVQTWAPTWQNVKLVAFGTFLDNGAQLQGQVHFSSRDNKKTKIADLDMQIIGQFPVFQGFELAGSFSLSEVTPTQKLAEISCGSFPGDHGISGRLKLLGVSVTELREWIQLPLYPEWIDGALQGTIDFSGDKKIFSIKCDLRIPQVSLFAYELPKGHPLRFLSDIEIGMQESRIALTNTILKIDDVCDIRFLPTEFLGTANTSLQMRATANVDVLSSLFWKIPVTGKFLGEGTVRFDKNVWHLNGKGSLDNTTVANIFVFPEPISGNFVFSFDSSEKLFSIKNFSATCGEFAKLTFAPISFGTTAERVKFPFELSADLSMLLHWDFVKLLETAPTLISGTLTRYDQSWELVCDGRVDTPACSMLNDLVLIKDSSGTVNINSGNVGGNVSADTLAVLGVQLSNLSGVWQYRDGKLNVEDVEGTLWNGKVKGQINQEINTAEMPGALTADLLDLNLDLFTRDFQPRDLVLTGLASGKLDVLWSNKTLQHAHIILSSSHDFSVNRSFLEWLLLAQYEQGKWSDKVFQSIRKKTLGTQPQFAFDSAMLDLIWDDHEYTGQIILKSKTLNLTISPRIEEEVITNALKLRQQTQFQTILQTSGKSAEKGE